VTAFGRSLKVSTNRDSSQVQKADTSCVKMLPCEVLDKAQAAIVKGDICEEQLKISQGLIERKNVIIDTQDNRITDMANNSKKDAEKIILLDDKRKRKNLRIFEGFGLGLLLGLIL
jgi:hypothetical protein